MGLIIEEFMMKIVKLLLIELSRFLNKLQLFINKLPLFINKVQALADIQQCLWSAVSSSSIGQHSIAQIIVDNDCQRRLLMSKILSLPIQHILSPSHHIWWLSSYLMTITLYFLKHYNASYHNYPWLIINTIESLLIQSDAFK